MPQNLYDESLQNREQVLLEETWMSQTPVNDVENLNTPCKKQRFQRGRIYFWTKSFKTCGTKESRQMIKFKSSMTVFQNLKVATTNIK